MGGSNLHEWTEANLGCPGERRLDPALPDG
jgi:hypothetical protein